MNFSPGILAAFAAFAFVLVGACQFVDNESLDAGPLVTDSAAVFAALVLFGLVLPGRFGLPAQIFIAMVLGIAAGWGLAVAGRLVVVTDYLGVFGQLFLLPLKMVIVPLVFVSVLLGAAGLGDVRKLGSVGLKVTAFFLTSTSVAVFIGMMFFNVIHPGRGMQSVGDQYLAEKAAEGDAPEAKEAPALSAGMKIQKEILPQIFQNPIMVTDTDKAPILAIITLALLLGAGLGAIGERSESAIKALQAADGALITIIMWIMNLAPLGVFALMVHAIATLGFEYLQSLSVYVITVVLGLVVHAGFLIFVMVGLVAGISPARYVRAMAPAMQVAFTTSSSNAALPINIRCAVERLGVDRGIVQFVLPIGATANMDGTALYTAVATLFVAEVLGIDMTTTQQLTIFVMSIVISIGTAGIPGGSIAMMGLIYDAVGLPLEALGLILGVDRVLDMCRTTVNVMGDSIGAAIVARFEGRPAVAPSGVT